jgi:NAD(P)-dependent dehydrogenase (short-subunit alcohol dehydrogenase family)
MVNAVHVDLRDKRAVVTGASRGIGAEIARRLADSGAEVLGLSRSEVASPEAGITHRRVDVTDEAALGAAIESFSQEGLDICVVNAGAPMVEDFVKTPTEQWRELIEINLVAAITTTRLALAAMLRDGGGRIIVISSAAGVRAEPDIPIYCATKAALLGLVQALAIRYAKDGVRVNAIAPGEIDTKLERDATAEVAESRGTTLQALHDQLKTEIPVGRLGTPEDIAGLALFLASEDASFITGQQFIVDGAQLLV